MKWSDSQPCAIVHLPTIRSSRRREAITNGPERRLRQRVAERLGMSAQMAEFLLLHILPRRLEPARVHSLAGSASYRLLAMTRIDPSELEGLLSRV